MIKMIVFDLDGTLFDQDKRIRENTTKKLIQLQEKGIRIGIATGRFYNELEPYIQQLKLNEYKGFVCCANGLEIHDYIDDSIKYFTKIDQERTYEFIQIAKQYHLISYVHEKEYYHVFGIHGLKMIQKALAKLHSSSLMIQSACELVLEKELILHEKMYDKICFFGSQKQIQKYTNYILKKYPGYVFYPVNSNVTEICHKDVGKLQAIQYLCSKDQIKMNEVMAFGDSGNDEPLLKNVGHGVCMINGLESTKKAAKHISYLSNDVEGVLDYLNRIYPS